MKKSPQAQLLNIPSSIADISYRYKMPPLKVRGYGKCNGRKTEIENLQEVAQALRISPKCEYIYIYIYCVDILKYFGNEIGSLTKIQKDGKFYVYGLHHAYYLQQILDE